MPNNRPQILLIEDEQQIRRFLRICLEETDFTLSEAASGLEGLQKFAAEQPEIVLVDLGLPDIDGIEVITQLRKQSTVPIIVLTARGSEQQKIEALDRGADDYVTKPFTVGELLARVRAALRRSAVFSDAPVDNLIHIGNLSIDLSARLIKKDSEEVHLTPIEFGLLTALVKNAGKVVTHNQLLKTVWGHEYVGETHYVRVHMAQLRHKLEENPARPKFFLTEPGVGYRLKG
jgi:two-component system KDP operon response regulator KdpE